MRRRALITGITGQDGSYLAELLLGEDYEVIGLIRRTSTVTFERISHIQDRPCGRIRGECSRFVLSAQGYPREHWRP